MRSVGQRRRRPITATNRKPPADRQNDAFDPELTSPACVAHLAPRSVLPAEFALWTCPPLIMVGVLLNR